MVVVMMTMMEVVVGVEAIASNLKDFDAHVDDGGVLVLFLSRSVQCTVWMCTGETSCFQRCKSVTFIPSDKSLPWLGDHAWSLGLLSIGIVITDVGLYARVARVLESLVGLLLGLREP